MSGIGGHVNQGDRARRRDDALVDRIRRYGAPEPDEVLFDWISTHLRTNRPAWQDAFVTEFLGTWPAQAPPIDYRGRGA